MTTDDPTDTGDGSTQTSPPTTDATGATTTATASTAPTSGDGSTAASSTGPAPDPVCGDGVVDPDEPCDDGNDEPDDGCDAQCARTGVPIWTQSWDGGANKFDFGVAVRMNADGDIFVAGSTGRADGFDDALVRRLDATGAEQAQDIYAGELGLDDQARALAIDESGGVLLGGIEELVDGGAGQAFLRRFAADGEVTWTYTRASQYAPGTSGIFGIAAAGDAVYVSGAEEVAAGVHEIYVQRLDPADGQPTWTVTFTDAHLSGVQGLAIAPDGDVILASATVDADDTPTPLIVRLAPADGAEVWNRSYDEFAAYARAIAVHPDGDLAVVGARYNPRGDLDIWTARLTGEGDVLWSDVYDHQMDQDLGGSVAWSSGGDLYVGGFVRPGGPLSDGFVRRYTGDGEVVWTSTYDDEAGGDDVILGVAAGEAQVVVVGLEFVVGSGPNQWIRAYEP